jgi:uncharacterized membrane protein YccF (DUF307 family)
MAEPKADPQPSPNSEPPAQPDPVPLAQWNRFGVVGALLCLGAAVLTAIGSFQALYAVDVESVSGLWRQGRVVTSWDFELTTNGVPDPDSEAIGAPLNGVPLMFAVAVLLATAVLGMLVAATPASSSRFGLAHRIAAVIAAVFLVATVWSVGMQELWYQDVLRPPDETSIKSTTQVGAGFWLLVAGAMLALVAAVVAWRPARADVWEREEPDTPVLGIPVVVRRLPDAPPDRPSGE